MSVTRSVWGSLPTPRQNSSERPALLLLLRLRRHNVLRIDQRHIISTHCSFESASPLPDQWQNHLHTSCVTLFWGAASQFQAPLGPQDTPQAMLLLSTAPLSAESQGPQFHCHSSAIEPTRHLCPNATRQGGTVYYRRKRLNE